MRIGIVPNLNATSGGVYQHSLTVLRTLHEWKEKGYEDEFVVFASEALHPALVSLNGRNWTVKSLPVQQPSLRQQTFDVLRRIVGEGPHREAWRWLRGRLQQVLRPAGTDLPDLDMVPFSPQMDHWFRSLGVELMLYLEANRLAFETGLPYVMAIHDLQHRLQPEFPEVSASGEWEWREYVFRNGARYATLLLADSEAGKQDILNCYAPYGVTEDRVKVLPYLPACYLDVEVSPAEQQKVRMTYGLPEHYLFYPAQFWPHKNHARIVQALGLIKQQYRVKVPIVFCGSHSGEIRERMFQEVISLSHQLRIEDQIHYLGYVPDEDMSVLYAEAVALVMPTFFGPTNIPVLEAWAFGCPVLTSDIGGIREQVGDAGLLVEPRSVEAIADGIYRIWTERNLRRTLADRGRQRLSSYTPEDFRRRLIEILEEAKIRARTGRPRNVS